MKILHSSYNNVLHYDIIRVNFFSKAISYLWAIGLLEYKDKRDLVAALVYILMVILWNSETRVCKSRELSIV